MPFIRDPPRSLSGPGLPTCSSTCFSRATRPYLPAGNSNLGSLFATRDSAKQRIEQTVTDTVAGQRREKKKEEGRKIEEDIEEEPRISSTRSDSL